MPGMGNSGNYDRIISFIVMCVFIAVTITHWNAFNYLFNHVFNVILTCM